MTAQNKGQSDRFASSGDPGSMTEEGKPGTSFAGMCAGAAILCGLLSVFISDLGGSYSKFSSWQVVYSSSNAAVANLFNYSQQVLLLILIVSCLFTTRYKGILLVMFSFFGFAAYFLKTWLDSDVSFLSGLFGAVPLVAFFIPLLIVGGYEENVWARIKRLSGPLSLLCFSLAIISFVKARLLVGWTVTIGFAPARTYLNYAYSALLVYVAVNVSNRRNFRTIVVLCALLIVCGVLLSSRSWIVQGVFLMFAVSIYNLDPGVRIKRILILAFNLSILSWFVVAFLPSAVEQLIDRLGSDSRSGQYEAFFGQVPVGALWLGRGVDAGYTFKGQDGYRFFDNQLIYLAFHFGVLPVLTLLVTLLKTALASLLGGPELKFVTVTVLVYLAASVGLSTYYSYELNVGTLFLFVVFGRCLFVSKNGVSL